MFPMPNIVIIDSNTDILSLLHCIFTMDKFTVHACSDVKNFLETLENTKPDVVMADINTLGTKDTVLSEIKEKFGVPIIVTSTKKYHCLNYKAFSADAGIEKPFCTKQLKQIVAGMLAD